MSWTLDEPNHKWSLIGFLSSGTVYYVETVVYLMFYTSIAYLHGVALCKYSIM